MFCWQKQLWNRWHWERAGELVIEKWKKKVCQYKEQNACCQYTCDQIRKRLKEWGSGRSVYERCVKELQGTSHPGENIYVNSKWNHGASFFLFCLMRLYLYGRERKNSARTKHAWWQSRHWFFLIMLSDHEVMRLIYWQIWFLVIINGVYWNHHHNWRPRCYILCKHRKAFPDTK